MNPFNPLSIVQSTFESDDVQHELKELVEIIRAYDIYDFLRRLSALNLQKENQNRAVLLDALQSAILYNDETYYTSSTKMSASKFSSIIKKLDSISLVHAIDPNENVFTQNVMLYDNYTVFNGIDSYPAYRLQMFCEIFFGFKNSFPLEYIKKVYFLFSAMLKYRPTSQKVLAFLQNHLLLKRHRQKFQAMKRSLIIQNSFLFRVIICSVC